MCFILVLKRGGRGSAAAENVFLTNSTLPFDHPIVTILLLDRLQHQRRDTTRAGCGWGQGGEKYEPPTVYTSPTFVEERSPNLPQSVYTFPTYS